MVTRADLEVFKGKIDSLVYRATALVQKGVPKGQLMAQINPDDLGWHIALKKASLTVSVRSHLQRSS